MIGKYLAAAKGPKNMAAKGSIGVAKPKAAKSSTLSAAVRSNRKTPSSRPTSAAGGSSAGLNVGKSTYIEMDGGGYQKMPRAAKTQNDLPSVAPFQPNITPKPRMSSYVRPDFGRLTTDRDLSRLI